MNQPLLLSRNKLRTFLECQRRFQLRYIQRVPWPSQPVGARLNTALEQGQQFHRLLEQHFLGFDVDVSTESDEAVKAWWSAFRRKPPFLPEGKRFPEMALSVPIDPIDGEGGHYLFGRFDLLILNDSSAHIYDWKTERKPRTANQLHEDWQTRLYLALIVEGASGLGFTYKPEQVAITYWFAQEPEQSVTIRYTAEQHARNLAELKATVERIDRRMIAPNAIWPLTESLETCQYCEFRSYCGREVATVEVTESVAEMALEDLEFETQLEPVPANTI